MLLLCFVTLFSLAVRASPIVSETHQAEPALVARNTTADDCSPFSPDGIQPSCWETLGMNDYLNNWWANNSARCDSTDRGFARCYLDTAGLITWSCDFIALNGCSPPPSGRDNQYSSYQEFYVIWNIYAINLYFTNYHAALLQGQATAIGAVAEIVKVVSPPVKKNPHTPLFGPIFGPSMAQVSLLGFFMGSSLGASLVFNSIMGLLGSTTGIVNILFPVTMVTQVSWEDLSASLSDNVNEFQKNIGVALTHIQTNYTLFYQLTNNGGFSQRMNTNLPANTDFLYHNLLKWTFNQALSQNDYFIVKNPGIDPRQIPIDPFDCSKLDEYGTCGPIWYDGKDAYGLARADDIGMNNMQSIVTVAFQKNWTTPSELYIDSQSCQGKNGSEAFDVQDLSLSCTSNLPVCEFNFDYNPWEQIWNAKNPPEYLNCPVQRGWGISLASTDTAGVPLTYLGPYLLSGVEYNENAGNQS
ncbi:hypothetical protein LZ31DRAFT_574354 [Colletotrichum somersetense]|nr:hypothetical protein LZ31DRAFT_574354 [Colletotrichum somersetense]